MRGTFERIAGSARCPFREGVRACVRARGLPQPIQQQRRAFGPPARPESAASLSMRLGNIRARAWDEASCNMHGCHACAGDDGVHRHQGCGVSALRAHVRQSVRCFLVLMMTLIICSASFHHPQARRRTHARRREHRCSSVCLANDWSL